MMMFHLELLVDLYSFKQADFVQQVFVFAAVTS